MKEKIKISNIEIEEEIDRGLKTISIRHLTEDEKERIIQSMREIFEFELEG